MADLNARNVLVWDDCTPTRERRETTEDDIREDLHKEEFETADDLYEKLLELADYEDEDVVDELGDDADIDTKITYLIDVLEDWGDGSPNILYCMINDYDLKVGAYDTLDGVDLLNASEEEIIEAEIAGHEFEDDDWYWHDYDDDDFEIDDTDDEEESDDDYPEDDTEPDIEEDTHIDEALSELDKMKMWHNGNRGLNIKACGNDKLLRYFDICRWQGFNNEASQLEREIRNRGLQIRTADDEPNNRPVNTFNGHLFESDQEEPDQQLADKAWMMNLIISFMNNEEAYYGAWLYIWPDGESKEQCLYDFGDAESYAELEDEFKRVYTAYHDDGLYGKRLTQEIIDAAHEWDKVLGLPEIEVLR